MRYSSNKLLSYHKDRFGKSETEALVLNGVVAFGPDAISKLNVASVQPGTSIEDLLFRHEVFFETLLYVNETDKVFVDIGTPEDLERAKLELRRMFDECHKIT